jgi:hypothetical protein
MHPSPLFDAGYGRKAWPFLITARCPVAQARRRRPAHRPEGVRGAAKQTAAAKVDVRRPRAQGVFQFFLTPHGTDTRTQTQPGVRPNLLSDRRAALGQGLPPRRSRHHRRCTPDSRRLAAVHNSASAAYFWTRPIVFIGARPSRQALSGVHFQARVSADAIKSLQQHRP